MQPEEGPIVRRLGAPTATLIVVADMVGTGVFTTTGFLVRDLGAPALVLLAWAVGGLFALCGALSYAELAAALPQNGGEYQLLSRIYHPFVGFLAGWTSLVVGFSAPAAAAALAFGHYLGAVAPIPVVPAAAALLLGLSVLHALDVTAGSGLHNLFTLVKVGLVLALIVLGLTAGEPSRAFAVTGAEATPLSPAFAVGLILVSFSYSGWNGAVYLAGEVRRPGRTLPLALFGGTLLVTVLYLALNVVFLSAAPTAELSGVVEVGHVAARRLFGPEAARLVSLVLALALVSTVSALVMAGPRVYEAVGRDHPALRVLSWRSRRGGPALAVALQAAVALLLILTATFEALLTFIGFLLSLFAGLTAFGLLVLRRREPGLERPYRAWGYPVTPLLFVALSAWMVLHAVFQRPAVALVATLVLAAGAVFQRLVRPRGGARPP